MDKKIFPKGIKELTSNERFRKTMKDILQESQSYYSGSRLSDKQLTNTLNEGFTMGFQNFVDDWSKKNHKKKVKDT